MTESGNYNITALRKIETGDAAEDFKIPLDTKFQMIWAESSKSSDGAVQHNAGGKF